MHLLDHISYSVELLRQHEPTEGYYLAFSGGKDSCVIKRLADMAGVKYDAHYHQCPDPPELLRFIRKHHPDVVWDKPKKPFFRFISENGMPTHRMRFCCAIAKEGCGKSRTKIIGVRAAESPRRAATWVDVQPGIIAPIVGWSDVEIWQFIHDENIPVCDLYAEGFHRLGCVGCPLAQQRFRDRDFARWPRYERAWMRACKALWARRADNQEWIDKQTAVGFSTWEEHWAAWRYELREFHARRKEAALCGDLSLDRYQQ